MSRNLKYANHLANIQNNDGDSCTTNCQELSQPAFRWVFSEISDPRNFVPVAVTGRYQNVCSGWAISLYDTLENSEKKYFDLLKDRPKLFKKLGTHVAEGNIQQSDGLCSLSNIEGHFDCHEYIDTDFSSTFAVVKALVSDEY